jgi:hypothetical protein
MRIDPQTESARSSAGTFGDCRTCQRRHSLPHGNARAHALDMMREFEAIARLDYLASDHDADPRLSFANLFAAGRGNMFGVLECEDGDGQTVILRAFSSLWDGIRQIEGWVLPVLSVEIYDEMILPAQQEIKAMTTELNGLDLESSSGRADVFARRKGISQALWKKMCASYRFCNFRGEERSLAEAVLPGTPITGGMGECCAPKLLNHAARHGLRPLGLAEFYWGSDKQGSRRVPGEFYESCEARCRPILGFMLCGLEDWSMDGA